jgi:hypothetical protein
MKLKIVFIVALISASTRWVQGQTAAELFVQLPESAFLTLTDSDRLDLIDLYKAGERATVRSRLNDSCSILRLTDNYLQLRTGKSTMELFILPMINDTKVVGLIQTVCAPVCDSYLEFYTTDWEKMNASVFITLAEKFDFLKEGFHPEDEKVKNALIPLDISLMQLQYEPDNKELTQHYTTPAYLSETDREEVKPYLTEAPKRFRWNQTRFE